MDIRVRRALLPALLAAALLLMAGWRAVPARAYSVDPELVAESVSEDGYYVDSSSRYLTSDADLDKLRESLEAAGRVGVVVLPSGTSTGPVVSRLLQEPNRTYLVLSGSRLQAVSNNMARSRMDSLLTRAKRAGDPESEVLTFLDLMSGRHPAATTTKHTPRATPTAGVSTDAESASPSTAPVAAAKKTSSGHGLLYGVVGVVVVLLLAVIGFVLWRRRQGTGQGPSAPPAY